MVNEQRRQADGIHWGRVFLFLLMLPPYIALFVFLPAGTWGWIRGWLFVVAFLAVTLVIFLYLWRVNPEVVIARSRPHQGTKRWDTALLWLLLPAMMAIMPVAALDDGRYHWFPLPWWACVTGYSLFFLGIGLTTWAEAVNKFFEPTVRIQTDRGHIVIETGPYALVRHPGYAGATVMAVGIALCLGSLYALIPAVLTSLLLILRTQWEDQTLQAELTGYSNYARRVRYKWIPGIW
jgi:protein-S-isoprenylcysteine O-methyltransferase Ste14